MLDLQIGEPSQNFNLEIDTSISTTWIPSVDCKNCKAEKKYNSSASISSITSNETIKIEDYLGNFKGIQVQDKVTIGAINFKMEYFNFQQKREQIRRGDRLLDGVGH